MVPTAAQLAPFVADGECYDIADAVAATFDGLRTDAGFYVHPDTGKAADHAWCVNEHGVIIDTTHGQFQAEHPVLIAKPGSAEHGRYRSWSEHHPEHDPGRCLHRALHVAHACSVATDDPDPGLCDYLGATPAEIALGASMRASTAARTSA